VSNIQSKADKEKIKLFFQVADLTVKKMTETTVQSSSQLVQTLFLLFGCFTLSHQFYIPWMEPVNYCHESVKTEFCKVSKSEKISRKLIALKAKSCQS
jgi:hypothetical protein